MSSAPPLGGIAAPPQATVGLAALFTAVSILGTAVPSLAPYLGLVPGYIVTRPWILITCAYFDSNPFKVSVHTHNCSLLCWLSAAAQHSSLFPFGVLIASY